MSRPDAPRDAVPRERGWWRKELLEQRLVAMFGAGCLLFNFPLLALWDRDGTLWGVPLFPAALFLVWTVLIVALGWVVEHADDAADEINARAAGDKPALPGGDDH